VPMTKTIKKQDRPTAPGKNQKKGRNSDDANRISKNKDSNQRTRATVRRLKMYRDKAPTKEAITKQYHTPTPSARIQPDKRWFGNTRVVGQQELQKFRAELGAKVKDPYSVLIKEKKLPLALLSDPAQAKSVNILETESFATTFGQKAQRKRARLAATDFSSLASVAASAAEGYDESNDSNIKLELDYIHQVSEKIFEKGQSRRIWGELYKVLDSSDVVIQVLDARDPMGTRCKRVEAHLASAQARHKHLVFVLNKCDLVPTWVTARWVKYLSKSYPTLAFHASITNSFGKSALMQLLRQFKKLHKDKQHISVGFIGYPNVGKSSIINTLRKKAVCKVAPVPGETKVWQYITLFRQVYLVDCPGVVYPSGDTETEAVLKGVVRIEKIADPAEHIDQVLERVKREYLQRQYQIRDWRDTEDFLSQIARRSGRLLKGNEPDLNTVAKMVLMDWQRGRLPYFSPPPEDDGEGPYKRPVPVAYPEGDEEGQEMPMKHPAPVVRQRFSKIQVSSAFDAEDSGKVSNDVDMDDGDIESVEGDDDDDEDDEPVDRGAAAAAAAAWEDIDFGDVAPDVLSGDDEEEDDEDAEDEEDAMETSMTGKRPRDESEEEEPAKSKGKAAAAPKGKGKSAQKSATAVASSRMVSSAQPEDTEEHGGSEPGRRKKVRHGKIGGRFYDDKDVKGKRKGRPRGS